MDNLGQAHAKTIAVVDDDVTILDAMQLLLESYQWAVRIYETGEVFLADFDNHVCPDCLILDPNLPGMNGSAIMRFLTNGNAHIPIIGLTARPGSPATIEMNNAGAYAMFTKPVTEELLVSQIHAVLIGDASGRPSATCS